MRGRKIEPPGCQDAIIRRCSAHSRPVSHFAQTPLRLRRIFEKILRGEWELSWNMHDATAVNAADCLLAAKACQSKNRGLLLSVAAAALARQEELRPA
jgi:hypothetical protein